jgi:hypothetical protein
MYQVSYVHTWRDIIKKRERKKEIHILVFLVEEDFGVDAATTTPPSNPRPRAPRPPGLEFAARC